MFKGQEVFKIKWTYDVPIKLEMAVGEVVNGNEYGVRCKGSAQKTSLTYNRNNLIKLCKTKRRGLRVRTFALPLVRSRGSLTKFPLLVA